MINFPLTFCPPLAPLSPPSTPSRPLSPPAMLKFALTLWPPLAPLSPLGPPSRPLSQSPSFGPPSRPLKWGGSKWGALGGSKWTPGQSKTSATQPKNDIFLGIYGVFLQAPCMDQNSTMLKCPSPRAFSKPLPWGQICSWVCMSCTSCACTIGASGLANAYPTHRKIMCNRWRIWNGRICRGKRV